MQFFFYTPKEIIESAWIESGTVIDSSHCVDVPAEMATPTIRKRYADYWPSWNRTVHVSDVTVRVSRALRKWEREIIAPKWVPGATDADMVAALDAHYAELSQVEAECDQEALRQADEWLTIVLALDLEAMTVYQLDNMVEDGLAAAGIPECPGNQRQREPVVSRYCATAQPIIARKRAEWEAKAAAEKAAAEAKKQADAAAEAAERAAWIAEHGSAHLKRLAADGYELGRTYTNERAAMERPGFVREASTCGHSKKRANPAPEEIAALDEVKALGIADAHLVWVSTGGDANHTKSCGADEYGTCDAPSGAAIECHFLGEEWWRFVG